MVVCYGFFSKKVGKHCGRLFTCCSRWRQRQQNPQQKVPKSTESKVGLVSDWCLNVTSSQEEKRVKSYLANIAAGGSAGHVPFSSSCFGFREEPSSEKKQKKTKTPSAAPSASSLPELLPKIAASTITAEEAPAAQFKPTPALWQGRAPSSSATAATSTPEAMLSTSSTCILACVIFLFSIFFAAVENIQVSPWLRFGD